MLIAFPLLVSQRLVEETDRHQERKKENSFLLSIHPVSTSDRFSCA